MQVQRVACFDLSHFHSGKYAEGVAHAFQNRKRRPPRKVPEGVPPARKTRLDCCRRRDLRPPRGIPPDPLDSCIISVTKSRVTGTRSGAFCLLVLAYFEILQSEPFLLGSHVPDVFPHLFSAFLQIL